ncbi:ribonuclease H-like domain-containing protein [Hypoxylon sp. FL1857]|nr:ribonuclease H-like domain-containing protein [Hypoxylon sp. FL1857]
MGDDGVWRPISSFDKNQTQWPLSYSLAPAPAGSRPRRWWDHRHYHGPDNQSVQILYSSSRSESEAIAQGLLNEPVLGFDMEWPIDADKSTRLQDKVALIQLACGNKVALFHIALHDGHTSEELIAPSLRRIVESPHILKAGVAIMSSGFRRLKDHFQLRPQGAFELSHLFHLITVGPHDPEGITVRLCELSKQVEHHFGLPLYRGDARMSDWNLSLDNDRKTYAANDAYAGYMLFHCMNAKRLGIRPIPPLPKLAESYLPFAPARPPDLPVQLEPVPDRPEPVVMIAKLFFPRQQMQSNVRSNLLKKTEPCYESSVSDNQVKEEVKKEESSIYNVPSGPEMSQKLLAQLIAHRKELARTRKISPYIIATNKVLEALARNRPANKSELLNIHGVGEKKAMQYGDEWLQMIAQDLAEHPKEDPEKSRRPSVSKTMSFGSSDREDDYQKPLDPVSKELYKQLAEHRKARAEAQKMPAFRVAPNTVLEALAQKRPSNNHELLLIKGIGQAKAADYGPDWLRIIADFGSEQSPQSSQASISRVSTISISEVSMSSKLSSSSSGSGYYRHSQVTSH